MSAAPRFPRELGYAGLRMTAEEYLALGETSERYELLDGVVFMSPSPKPRHNRMLSFILGRLEAFSEATTPLSIYPETDLYVHNGLVYRPDIQAFLLDRLGSDPDSLRVPPDLIIEILSDSTRALDLVTKKADYEQFGVREYWVVEPADGSVRQFARRNDRTAFDKLDSTQIHIRSVALPGFVLDLAPLKAIAG